ncbi:MAG TPA: hypothetical protein VMI52_08820 [Acetobacteraceae bacterium]|nr:hypothetical protein [Acetobacteraceae bacterium]
MDGKPTPLDVLLHAMHRKWDEGDLDGAAALAKVAAPYLHARLPAARPEGDVRAMSDAELDGVCTRGRGSDGAADAADDTH